MAAHVELLRCSCALYPACNVRRSDASAMIISRVLLLYPALQHMPPPTLQARSQT